MSFEWLIPAVSSSFMCTRKRQCCLRVMRPRNTSALLRMSCALARSAGVVYSLTMFSSSQRKSSSWSVSAVSRAVLLVVVSVVLSIFSSVCWSVSVWPLASSVIVSAVRLWCIVCRSFSAALRSPPLLLASVLSAVSVWGICSCSQTVLSVAVSSVMPSDAYSSM